MPSRNRAMRINKCITRLYRCVVFRLLSLGLCKHFIFGYMYRSLGRVLASLLSLHKTSIAPYIWAIKQPIYIAPLALITLSGCQEQGAMSPEPSTSLTPAIPSCPPEYKDRPKLPIEYMAEHNVAPSGVNFAESDAWRESGYFTYEQATQLKIEGYHLPTPEEMNGVLPIPHKNQHSSNANAYPKVFVGVPKFNAAPPILIRDDAEVLQVGRERIVCSSLYGVVGAYTGRRVSYALRFYDEGDRKYYSAFRYEILRINPRVRLDDALSEYRIQIRVRYLGKDSPIRPTAGDMELVCSEGWWAKNHQYDIVRYLPNCGFIFDPSSQEAYPSSLGIRGRYWLQESSDTSMRRYRYLEMSNSSTGMAAHELFPRMPIRLFTNK